MSNMTFEEAAMDPRRPLSLTPREWMYSVEATLAEENELTDGVASRLLSAKKAAPPKEGETTAGSPIAEDSGTGLEKIDMGIDQLVQGCKLIESGLLDARMADLKPTARKAVETIRDLLETAIEPYLVDIINASDSLDEEEEGK